MFASAAARGRAHEGNGQPCQDYAAGRRSGGVAVVALADGAGSAARSDVGARVAVETTIVFLLERFADALAGDEASVRTVLVDVLRARLEEEARRLEVVTRELATTLLFVAVNRGQFLAGHVGDGVIGCERAGVLEVLSHPEHGEFLNETTFVTSSRAAERLALHRGALEGRSAFVLMSDGSAESLYRRRDGSLAPGVASMCTWLDRRAPDEVEIALQRSLGDVIGPQTRDDCSLAILREVVTPSSHLGELGVSFQRAFLDCTNARALEKRVAIASLMGTFTASPAEIARQVGVAPATARRHLSALRGIVDVRP